MPFLVVFIVSFLLGSIPSGVIISRLFFHTDVRSYGSGNIGTTNAMRSLGKVGGAVVFLIDFGKGLLSGLLALPLVGAVDSSLLAADATGALSEIILSLAFFSCVVGHIYSPWLKFKGGKGIAVSVGCLFVTYYVWGACLELLIFFIGVGASKRVSVGSIASALACPFFALYYFWGNALAICLCTVTACLVVWAHRKNIVRLKNGEEEKFHAKK